MKRIIPFTDFFSNNNSNRSFKYYFNYIKMCYLMNLLLLSNLTLKHASPTF